MGEMVRHMEEC